LARESAKVVVSDITGKEAKTFKEISSLSGGGLNLGIT